MAEAAETLIAKIQLKYNIKEPHAFSNQSGVSTSSDWRDGMGYLTNISFWLADSSKSIKVPVGDIIDVVDTINENHTLVVRYRAGTYPDIKSMTAFLNAPDSVLNYFKHKLFTTIKKKPEVKQDSPALEKKLVILLYMGTSDVQSLQFFLGTTADRINALTGSLKEKGYVDSRGRLTPEGHKYARQIREVEMRDRIGAP
ncbi:MAG: hypothetical protein WC974_05510 [Thermoplasmata archaeon]